MSRDGSGNYTLPLPSVVSGTAITAAWANTTLDDIEAELSDSLDRHGRGGMTVAFKNLDGTVSSPGISFTEDPGTGFRRSATNVMNAVVDGTDIAKWYDDTGTGSGSQRPFQIWDGAAYFSPIDRSSPLGASTFASVGSRAASTVGNTLSVTAGLSIDADGAAITGDSDITGNLTASGLKTSGALTGGYVRGSTGQILFHTGTIGLSFKLATGKYKIESSAPWTDPSNPTLMAVAIGNWSTKRVATVEKLTSNTIVVYVHDLTTGSLTDNDFIVFGVQ